VLLVFLCVFLSSWLEPQNAFALDPYKAITQYGHKVWRTQDGLPQDSVQAIAQTPDGYLWLGTRGGLIRFDGLQFTSIQGSTAQGFRPDIVNALLVGRDGSLWIGQENEVLTRLKDGQFQIVDPLRHIENGKYSLRFVRAFWEAPEGDLWFATTKGLVMIDPADLKLDTLRPPVIIERAIIGKQAFDPRLEADAPPGSGDVEIPYTGLSFQAPEKVRFRYLLEGFDKEWVDAGTRRMAYYTHLPPGDYRFRVMASNSDGVWNETNASFDFHLSPYFYQRSWFFLICAAIVTLMALAVHRFRVKAMKARFSAVFAERNRIAGELHDTVEQGLAMILLHLESAAAKLPEPSGLFIWASGIFPLR
jgi:hypothetical protein